MNESLCPRMLAAQPLPLPHRLALHSARLHALPVAGKPSTPMAQVIGEALPSEITSDYDVGETLGTGHFSKVKLGTDKKTGEKVAIKVRSP